jgi:hypothetical protein
MKDKDRRICKDAIVANFKPLMQDNKHVPSAVSFQNPSIPPLTPESVYFVGFAQPTVSISLNGGNCLFFVEETKISAKHKLTLCMILVNLSSVTTKYKINTSSPRQRTTIPYAPTISVLLLQSVCSLQWSDWQKSQKTSEPLEKKHCETQK